MSWNVAGSTSSVVSSPCRTLPGSSYRPSFVSRDVAVCDVIGRVFYVVPWDVAGPDDGLRPWSLLRRATGRRRARFDGQYSVAGRDVIGEIFRLFCPVERSLGSMLSAA